MSDHHSIYRNHNSGSRRGSQSYAPYNSANQTTPQFSAGNNVAIHQHASHTSLSHTQSQPSSFSAPTMTHGAPYYHPRNASSTVSSSYQPAASENRSDGYHLSQPIQPLNNPRMQYDYHASDDSPHARSNSNTFSQAPHTTFSQQYGTIGDGHGYSNSQHFQNSQSSYPNNSTSSTSLGQYTYQQPRADQNSTARPSTIKQPHSNATSASYPHKSPIAQPSEISRSPDYQSTYDSPVFRPPASLQTTVNPSEVYDPYHEYSRQARQSEAVEPRHLRASPPPAGEPVSKATPDAEVVASRTTTSTGGKDPKPRKEPKTASEPKNPRKPRTKKSQATSSSELTTATVADSDGSAQAAALTLMQTANSGVDSASQLEAQMKAMFQQMRQFNQANPDMLARLWQQERNDFVESEKKKTTVACTIVLQAAHKPANVRASPQQSKIKANMAAKYGEKAQSSKTTASETYQSQLESAKTVATSRAPTTPSVISQTGAAQPNPSIVPALSGSPSTSQQAMAPLAQRSTTIWPANKKAVLAAAAVRILNASDPRITITTPQVSSMLDTNPTYIQLYEKFLALGFHLDRSTFAKALLNAVPEINRAPRPDVFTGTSANNTNTQALITPMGEARTDPATQAVLVEAEKRMASGETLVATPIPSGSSSLTSKARKLGRPPKGMAEATEPVRPSYSAKLSALDPDLEGLDAVKRFLDGTSATNKQPESPAAIVKPRKVANKTRPCVTPVPPMKKDLARKQTFLDLVDLTQHSDNDDDLLMVLPSVHGLNARTDSGAESSLANEAVFTTEHSQPMDLEVTPSLASVAQVVSPEHAEPGQFPVQLAEVAVTARVAQYPKPVRTAPSIPALPLDHPARSVDLVKPLDKYNAIRRSGYNAKLIARDVLLAAGRHPDMRDLNAHLEILKVALPGIDNNADLSTFRWDLVDPGGPEPGSGSIVHTSIVTDPLTVDDADDEDEDLDHIIDQGRRAVRQVIGSDWHGLTPTVILPTQSSKRKRTTAGKPPRQAAAVAPVANSTVSNGDNSGTPQTYAALRAAQMQAASASGSGGVPVKPRGRPVGWRKWMQKGSTTPTPSTNTPKPQPPPVDYKIYRCEWDDCTAELHNLATLRKHIHKIHVRRGPDDHFTCQWRDCGMVRTTTENDRTTTRFILRRYTTDIECRAHIENAHIKPIAWSLGDGPAGGVSDPDASSASDAYLSDSRGRRVTPRIDVSEEQARAAADPSVTVDVGRRRARLTGDEAAAEAREMEERRRRAIGPGIDRGGARLANEKRRAGFVDDGDEGAVVVNDDEDEYA